MNKLKTAIEWRKNYYHQLWLKLYWEINPLYLCKNEVNCMN